MRKLIISIGILGTVIFGAMFFTSLLNPAYVEQIGRELIRLQVEKKVQEKVATLDQSFLAKKAELMIKGRAQEIESARRQLSEGLPEKIAGEIARMRNLDCECRKKIEQNIRQGHEWVITTATAAQERLTALIRTRYMETAEKITREFRIVTGMNALVFALLALAPLVKRKAGLHLLPVALVLVLAAGLTAYFYLFNQDWLHTIVFNDYVGFGYAVYLGVVFAFFSDIFFNRGRLTIELLGQVVSNAGSALSPC